ncbi:MAG: hypothetical protein J6N74_08075 [Chryseobacterium sp.]|nr:hypothetical protein [Chryseobacterium sp.]
MSFRRNLNSLDSYGMTNFVFIDKCSSVLKSAARLEWKSFFAAGKAKAKRLGTEDGNSCPNDNP